MGRIEEIAEEHRVEAADPAELHRRAFEQRMRRIEEIGKAREAAMAWAQTLLGRVIFPARWSAAYGKNTPGCYRPIVCRAVFEGRLELVFTYNGSKTEAGKKVRLPGGTGKQELPHPTPSSIPRYLERWEREAEERQAG